jgi:lactate dehydrogenase-like 2-hydroxyacid dehydrogenase
MPPQLVLACTVPHAVKARAQSEFSAIAAEGTNMAIEQVIAAIGADRIPALAFTSSIKLNAETIARLPVCLKIAATISVGYDHVDVAAAKARGLVITNTPDVLTNATADLAFMLILNACRRAHEYDSVMREGWRQRFGQGDFLGIEASGKRLGIIGMGRIGRAVAQRGRGFDMKIHYSNRTRLPPELEQGAVYHATVEDLLPHCDILSLHAPGGAATDKLMNAARLALLPKGAVLVNTSRGSLVDEDALLEALQSGHLFAAGLDVFRSEPEFDLRFAALPNVFLAPHMGSATIETRNAMGNRALDNVAAFLAGKGPIDPLWT